MQRKIALALILLSSTQILFGQQQGKSGDDEFVMDVDTPAEYPGGLPALYAYFQLHLKYPLDARRKGIEGKTFIEFIVNGAGYILPRSVRPLKSLYPSCDLEAMRVIKACTTQWKPAIRNGKGVNQRFVLPISFSLTEGAVLPPDPLHPIELPIKTVVVAKTYNSQKTTTWTLYSDAQTSIKSGTVSIGDSVEVTGWAPWSYYIRKDTTSGYVSWKALELTEELERLSKIVSEQSPTEYVYKEPNLIYPKSKFMKANAFTSVNASKNNIYVGECATITLAFNVHHENRAPLQFYELGGQLVEIVGTQLTPDNCYIRNFLVDEVIGENILIGEAAYTTYPIYKASYCPTNPGTLVIPPVSLRMAKVRAGPDGADSILSFKSKALTIKTNAIPTGISPSLFEGFPLVGRFGLTDSLLSNSVHVGDVVTYKVTITGNGLTFPINAPEIKVANVIPQLMDISDTETSIGDQLQSRKTFVYKFIFEKPGVYDLSGKIAIRYFNPATKKVEMIKSGAIVTVANAINSAPVKLVKTFGSKNNFIAIDASQSMQIEDYFPNRLEAVKMGLSEFLMGRDHCEVGLILFGGDAKHFAMSNPEKCYTRRFIDSIDFNFNTNGTAIGDAIWLAKNSFAKNSQPKKLVIIGDGDNTAGHIPPKLAAKLAEKYSIVIYTIGVGTSGLVPYGVDKAGKPNMIDNTFTDKDFKIISSITNGKYYWAKDEQELTKILKIIFP